MKIRRVVLSTATVALSLALAGCGGSEEPKAEDTPKPTTSSSSPTEPAEPTSEAPAAGDGKTPAWAMPVTTKGEKLGTIKADGFSVDVYQVAKGKTTRDSMFVDPKTNKNIAPAGSPVVFVNYVVTNTGSAPLPLGASVIGIRAKYADWPYMQGMPGETDSDAYEALGLTDDAHKVGEDTPYVLGAGETINVADSYIFQGPKELELEFTLTPVDDEGDLVHDKKIEAEGSVKLK